MTGTGTYKRRKGDVMMKKRVLAEVTINKEIAPGIFDLWMEPTQGLEEINPGQFIGVYLRNENLLLPRPLSICEVNADRSALRLVYRRAGEGTHELSRRKPKDGLGYVPILGPLGNGFPLEKGEGKRALIIGGGIGIPPLVELSKRLKADRQIVLGYQNGQTAGFLQKDLEQFGDVHVATEDGSIGVCGNVMDLIRKENLQADVIYACGPMPMLKAVKEFAGERGIPAYISLEEHMACGVGVCLGCVVKTREVHPHTNVHNARICTDGPVFEAGEVEI